MKLRLAAGCAGSILLLAAAASAQPVPPPPPPPADDAGDSYSPDESTQSYDDDAGEPAPDDQGYADPGYAGQDPASQAPDEQVPDEQAPDGQVPDDQGYGDGQAYSDAGEPLTEGTPADETPADDLAAEPYADDRGVDPSVPPDAEEPPYAYPAPGADEPPYPPQPPLPPEPPTPGMENTGAAALEMREERLAHAIRQGMRRGEIDPRDAEEARRELESISYERRELERRGLADEPDLARLDDRLRQLQVHVSRLRRAARR